MRGLTLLLGLALLLVTAAGPPGLSVILSPADAVNGMIAVPDTKGGEVLVRGDGKTPVTLWFDRSWAEIHADARGIVVVTDVHATGQRITLVQVPVLYFAGAVGLRLPALTPLAAAAPAAEPAAPAEPAPSPVPPASHGPALVAPALSQPHGPDQIAAIRLRNPGPAALDGRVVVFGQAFAPGELPAGATLAASGPAGPVPVQATIKARHADGSARHAVIALQAPPLAAGAAVEIMLARGGTPPAGSAATPDEILSRGYDLQLVLALGDREVVVDAAQALQAAAARGSLATWLSGPLAVEYRVGAAAGPLRAIFDIRATADHAVATDVIVANDLAYQATGRVAYAARLASHGKTLWQAEKIEHGRFQVWHRVVSDGPAPPEVQLDVPHLIRAAAIPAFDLSLGLSGAAIDDTLRRLEGATGPLGPGLVTRYMPTTGGRDDIGIVPMWTANWLVSQDPRARRAMLANADAAGSVPWHLAEADGSMVTAEAHPQLWLDERCKGRDCLPGGFDPAAEGWTLDTAHVPDLAFVPYLVTGRRFYLDQLQAEANWELLAGNPGYRGDARCLVYPLDQIRGVAWDIRDMANAAWITPDDDRLKRYFVERTEGNLRNLYETQVAEHRGPAVGQLEGFVFDRDHPEEVAPWQQDLLATVVSLEAERGFADAGPLARWMSGFVAGRFRHGADGLNPLNATAYWPRFVDPASGRPVTTWRAFAQLNFKGEPSELDGYPADNGGYAAVARAATASLYSATRSAEALGAFAFLASATPAIYPSFQNGAFYDINPVLPDGHVLQNSEIRYARGDETLTAPGRHALLIGGPGRTSLKAGGGLDILFAGGGPATLAAGAGTSFLFGGAGPTTMVGAPGSHLFAIGGGPTRLILTAGDAADDTVSGFKPGIDHLHVAGLAGPVAGLLQAARPARTADGAGVALTLAPGHRLTLVGLSPAQLTPALLD